MSDYTTVGAVVGQGTLGGALLSQGVLDEGISGEFAPGGEDEINYGEILLAPFIFQDDVIHAVGGLDKARRANEKTDRAVKKLNLSLN